MRCRHFPKSRRTRSADAFTQAFTAHLAEIEAITADPQPPSFDNTIVALERSGRALTRVSSLFHALAGAHSNDTLLEIEREISPKLAAHWNKIRLDDALFARIDALWRERDQLALQPRAGARAQTLSHDLPPGWSGS